VLDKAEHSTLQEAEPGWLTHPHPCRPVFTTPRRACTLGPRFSVVVCVPIILNAVPTATAAASVAFLAELFIHGDVRSFLWPHYFVVVPTSTRCNVNGSVLN
jgi:hypothetical protein